MSMKNSNDLSGIELACRVVPQTDERIIFKRDLE